MLIKQKVEIPFITLLASILFIACYSFKAGEAFFFGYPAYYIYLDLSSVLNLSVKLLFVLVLSFGSMVWLFDDDGKLKVKSVKYLILIIVVVEVFFTALKINRREQDFVSYISGGMGLLCCYLMVYFSVNSFKKTEEGLLINVWGVLPTLVFLPAFFFITGINYQNQFGSMLWVTKDNQFVIGEYKDSLILKKCVDGESVFYLKDYKDNEFKSSLVDVTSNANFRCRKSKVP